MKTKFLLSFALLLLQASTLSTQWIHVNAPNEPLITHLLAVPIATGDTALFLSTRGTLLSPDSIGGVFYSTDNGEHWTSASTGISKRYVMALALSDTTLFAGTCGSSHGIYRSHNHGTSWTISDSGLGTSNVFSIVASHDSLGNTVLLAETDINLFRSTDNGTSWQHSGLSEGGFVNTLVTSATKIFAGTNCGIFLTTNSGINWSRYAFIVTCPQVFALAVEPGGSEVLVSTDYGAYRSSNEGKNWSKVTVGTLTSPYAVHFFYFWDTTLLAGTTNGVFMSSDDGASWRAVNEGLTTDVDCPLVFRGYLYVTSGNTIWRRQLSEMVTAVPSHRAISSSDFELSQNYPNPFNPSTVISFLLPSQAFTTLKIYDQLGREITTLVSGELQAGAHTQFWNAKGIPSALYFYQLHSGYFSATKTLVLLK